MSIVTLGTVALDTIKTPAGKRSRILGGSASHFAMSARFFSPVHIVANVGTDFPPQYLMRLQQLGANIDSVQRDTGKTFHWEGAYEHDLNTALTLKTELGVLSSFNPKVTPTQKAIKTIFLANVDPLIQSRFITLFNKPSLVGLDSMNYWIQHKRDYLLRLLRTVDIYFANDAEARQLTGERNLTAALGRIRRWGVPVVIIKKGEHGVIFNVGREIFCLPAYPVENIIDPTGAGDTFAGGVMGYLSHCRRITADTLKKAIVYGTVSSSFNVEGFGTERMMRLHLGDIKRRLNVFRKKVVF